MPVRWAVRAAGVAGVAAGSFLLGRANLEESPFRRLDAATAVAGPNVPMPMPITPSDKVGLSRASQIMQYGYPGFDNLRTFEDFVLSYDRKTRTAHWVMEHLTSACLKYDESIDRSKSEFKADESVHEYFRAKNDDYKGSGYDRGHLAAAGNHRRSQKAMDETFFLSNMSPQVGRGFNRDKWNDLERHVRKLAKKACNTYVLTGPLYLPKKDVDGHLYVKYKVIGKSHVAVPTHFFKAILVETAPGTFDMECYLMPNEVIPDSVDISSFLVPREMIERNAGFLIFDKLPKGALKKVNGKKLGGLW